MNSLADLRAVVVNQFPEFTDLKNEVAVLRKENAVLKEQLTDIPPPPAPSPLNEEFLKLGAEDNQAILSTDMGLYKVGTTNMAARIAWTSQRLRELAPGLRLLDAGAGECMFKKDCAHLDYVSQDIAVYDGKGGEGLQTGVWDTSQIDLICDIVSVPEPDASFDVILCTEVLEHVPSPVAALEEMARLLKPGGTLILTAPFWSLTHFAPFHYATGFNRYFYEHHLKRLGFDITELTPNGNFFESVAQEIRRTPEIAEKFSHMPPTMLERYAIQIMLSMMDRLSASDSGSTELLYYGSLVRAIKKS